MIKQQIEILITMFNGIGLDVYIKARLEEMLEKQELNDSDLRFINEMWLVKVLEGGLNGMRHS